MTGVLDSEELATYADPTPPPPTGNPRRRAVVASGVVLLLVLTAVLVALLTGGSDGEDEGGFAVGELATLRVPDPGTARAMWLDDGWPVWVLARADGSVAVFDARSPHSPFGIGQLVGWCDVVTGFEDPGGSTFYSIGAARSGPAPWGLSPYSAAVVNEGQTVRVLAPGDPVAAGAGPVPARGAAAAMGLEENPDPRDGLGVAEDDLYVVPSCIADDRFGLAIHAPRSDPIPPEEAVGLRALPIAVEGHLDVRADRPSLLCSTLVDGRCPSGSPHAAGVTASESINEFVGDKEVLLVRPSVGALSEVTRFIPVDVKPLAEGG